MSDSGVRKYDPVAVGGESTVVAEYITDTLDEVAYQSESQLEQELLQLLQTQAYEYLPIASEAQLKANLRHQLEIVNGVTFSDSEWQRFFDEKIASANDGVAEKTKRIQEDHTQILIRDDRSTKNIHLIDKKNIHNNRLQVINQYEVGQGEGGAKYTNRYDVTVLVNGLPLVHIELKRRGVAIREAFNQIDRYQRESFWSGSGLFQYVQLFVISNGTQTKYYSNTTRMQHSEEAKGKRQERKSSNSFEFTSWWADAQNKPIQDLMAFARTFFAKHTLLNILTKYCVLTENGALLVMRPYQIVATERIIQRIMIASNYKKAGTIEAGGYVWHTTGSGKTLTSFKTAQLASKLDYVDKVLFVVDRKDLDYQTMREYDRFEKGAANSNTSTAVLKAQLEDPSKKIIITTIQKLSNFVAGNKGHAIYGGNVVLIFDECHRSQFGDMHQAITKAFKKYYLFGFTGTPIFAENANTAGKPTLRTTEQVFGDKLHTYTIVDAITDKNVLPFRIDYINTVRVGDVDDKQVSAIDTEKALLAPERISEIVRYILTHFDQKTKRNGPAYEHATIGNVTEIASNKTRAEVKEARQPGKVRGFNSLFATSSIQAAKQYYAEFARQQAERPPVQRLRVGLIYTYAANEADNANYLDEEAFDTGGLDRSSRDFLENAIRDYNAMFGTSYDTSSDSFQGYYKDLSMRLKNRQLDLVIVVNMFLTGFDATTLNTLWVDKNLKSHGLIQAYSRTNRILNSVKTYGNIVSFRNLEEQTNDALALFGNKEARGIVLLKPYQDYYDEYAEQVSELLEEFPLEQEIIGEENQKRFIGLFGRVLRLQNILSSFDEFEGEEILSPRQDQNYRSRYLDLHAEYRGKQDADKEEINDDLVFEIELIKQVEINVDYVLMLVEKHREKLSTNGGNDAEVQEVRSEISRAVDASPSLRDKKDLVEGFVDSVSLDGPIGDEWQAYIAEKKEVELQQIIEEEKLKPDEAKKFVAKAFRDGEVPVNGTAITNVLPPTRRFNRSANNHGEKKKRVLNRLGLFFDRFFGLSSEERAA